jgi:2-aminoadipate transaminase
MNIDLLAEKLRDLQGQNIKPKFIYTIASNQNPTGTNMSVPRRKRLISLAREYELLIVEDDCYADLHFEGDPPPPCIYALADFSNVIYIGSFSKILGPGVRLGYLSASEELLTQILSLKIDGGTSNLAAYIVGTFLKNKLWEHLETVNKIIKTKRDAVMEALDHYSPEAFEWWTRPTGGLFIWIKLPDTTDTPSLWKMLDERGVHLAPGRAFHSRGKEVPFLRIAFGYPTVADIQEGVGVIAECVQKSCIV